VRIINRGKKTRGLKHPLVKKLSKLD